MRPVNSCTSRVTLSQAKIAGVFWPGSSRAPFSKDASLVSDLDLGLVPWCPSKKSKQADTTIPGCYGNCSSRSLRGSAPPAPPNHAADVTRAAGSRVVVGSPGKLLPGQCRTLGSGGRRGGRGEAEPVRGRPGAGRKPSGGDGGGRAGGGAARGAAASRADG